MSEENKYAIEEQNTYSPLHKLPDLKTIREERGVRIEDISSKTMICTTILNAIENGEFHLLPAPVYARKFIQIYAEAVGIDAGIILALYQRHLNGIQAAPEEPRNVNIQITSDRKPFTRYFLYAVPAVAIIAATVMVYAFFHNKVTLGTIYHLVTVHMQKKAVPKPAPAVKEQPPKTVANVPHVLPPPTAAAPKETTQTPDNARLDLLIEATEDTWLNITEDRNPSFQTVLKKGDKLSRKAREFFVIDVGNAAGVNITFLGKSLGTLGRKGQVVHLRLPQH